MRQGIAAFLIASVSATGALIAAAHAAGADTSAVSGDVEAVAAKATSSACFNEGFVNKGSTVDWDQIVKGDGGAPERRTVILVRGEKKFNGFNAVETLAKFYDEAGNFAAQNFGYTGLKSGRQIQYGLDSATVRQLLDPPLKQPISMAAGEATRSKYRVTQINKQTGKKEASDEDDRRTFVGFDTFTSKVGKFKVCRFDSKITTKSTGVSYTIRKTDLVAAEGKYRGFTLRTKISGKYSTGMVINQVIEVTKIRKFSMK